MKLGVVPEGWKVCCIIPFYKGRSDRSDCGDYRRISLLSIPRKKYDMILINTVEKRMRENITEEHGGFRSARGCTDQILIVK